MIGRVRVELGFQAHRIPPGVPGTALSGGDFAQRLREAMAQRTGPLGLDVQRLRMDFTLPARNGEGVPLSQADFQALVEREDPAVFFSQELCARYFTYRKGGETRFVLFDDAETLRRKLRIARESGIPDALCVYPEVQDLLPRLFPGK